MVNTEVKSAEWIEDIFDHSFSRGYSFMRLFGEFAQCWGVDIVALANEFGSAMIDVEWGAEISGLIRLAESVGVNQIGASIVATEPVRQNKPEIGDVLQMYNDRFGVEIIRGYPHELYELRRKFGVITRMNMLPGEGDRYPDTQELVYRVERCEEMLVEGGIGLITQLESSERVIGRYMELYTILREGGHDVELFEGTSILGKIGIVIRGHNLQWTEGESNP